MTALAHIAPLTPLNGKLVRLLASDHDYEALGAARAIQKVLGSAELDLHDLASLIEATADNPNYRRAPPTPRSHAVRVMLRACDECRSLTNTECTFVRAMAKWRGELTPKQFARLSAIYERLLAGGHI